MIYFKLTEPYSNINIVIQVIPFYAQFKSRYGPGRIQTNIYNVPFPVKPCSFNVNLIVLYIGNSCELFK